MSSIVSGPLSSGFVGGGGSNLDAAFEQAKTLEASRGLHGEGKADAAALRTRLIHADLGEMKSSSRSAGTCPRRHSH